MSSWVRVAAVTDCDVGTLKAVMVEEIPIVLANVEGDIFALQDDKKAKGIVLNSKVNTTYRFLFCVLGGQRC